MSVETLIEAARLTPIQRSIDWEQVQGHLATTLPSDYRTLVEAGGAGLWFDDLRLYSPGDPVEFRDLTESTGVFEDLLFFWENRPESRPADLPDDARLIAWADTSHGETLFWRIDADNDTGVYPIYIEDGDGARWERFDLSSTDLLLGILHGTVSSQLFSNIFMDTAKVFRPYPHQTVTVTVTKEPRTIHCGATHGPARAPGVHDERPEKLDGELRQICSYR